MLFGEEDARLYSRVGRTRLQCEMWSGINADLFGDADRPDEERERLAPGD